LFVPGLVECRRQRFKTHVLAQVRFTQFLCRIPDIGGAYVSIGGPVLCSGKTNKNTLDALKIDCPGLVGINTEASQGA
jgi:hypothetical protein